MRTYGVFLALLGMLVAVGFLLATSPREPYKAPAEEPDPDTLEGGAALSDARAPDAALASPLAPLDAAAPAAAAAKLRVAVLSWELAAPVVGMEAAAVEATVLSTAAGVETRLARGGDDAEGADVAIMPLAEFIGMYDRLRALEPFIVAVAGYSHGEEELTAPADAAVPKAGDSVGSSGELASTMLALYALDFMRTDVSKVKLVTDPAEVANAAWASGPHAATKRRIVLSSADASRLLPDVIVAPRRTREAKKAELVKLVSAWFEGTARVRGNATGVAKDLEAHRAPLFSASSDKPKTSLEIVERLGQIEWAAAQENADAFGLDELKVEHIDDTVALSWRLLRTAGVVAASTPSQLPITKDFVADATKSLGDAPKPPAPAELLDDAGAPKGLTVLLTRRYDDADDATLVADIGLASRLFDHAQIRVTTRGGDKSSRAVAQKARKEASSDRVFPGSVALGNAGAAIEICVAP